MLVVIRHKPCHDMSSTETIGVTESYDTAMLLVLKDAFSKLNYEHYDPAKRFYRGRCEWRDNWEGLIGIDDYFIENWVVDGDRSGITYFNFDDHVKRETIKHKMSSANLKILLMQWKAQVLERHSVPDELRSLFQDKQIFCTYSSSVAEEWIEMYGSVAPYPFSEDREIEYL